MSWQAYVDANLVGTGAVTQAGIYDLQGNPWAYTQSPPFAAQIAEVAAVSAHCAAPSGLAATGVTIAGVKYMYVSGEENTEIYAKKGNEGVAFYRCNTCILVAYHNDKIQPGQCRTVLAKLGDFLKESVRAMCLVLASHAAPARIALLACGLQAFHRLVLGYCLRLPPTPLALFLFRQGI